MTQLTSKEIHFVKNNDICRFATSLADKPHVVPVSYLYKAGNFYVASDYKTKNSNIKKNPHVGLVVDIYIPNGNRGLTIQGFARLIECGQAFKEMYDLFFQKFDWVRNEPWKEGDAPFIEIVVLSKSSWGIN